MRLARLGLKVGAVLVGLWALGQVLARRRTVGDEASDEFELAAYFGGVQRRSSATSLRRGGVPSAAVASTSTSAKPRSTPPARRWSCRRPGAASTSSCLPAGAVVEDGSSLGGVDYAFRRPTSFPTTRGSYASTCPPEWAALPSRPPTRPSRRRPPSTSCAAGPRPSRPSSAWAEQRPEDPDRGASDRVVLGRSVRKPFGKENRWDAENVFALVRSDERSFQRGEFVDLRRGTSRRTDPRDRHASRRARGPRFRDLPRARG